MPLIERFQLDKQVAIVTGGGRGIGRAIAMSYAEAGADVVCAARTLADVEAVAEEVRALGRRALAVQCDVTDLPQLAGVVEAALKAFGRITHLVNNAGGSGPNDPMKMSAEKFEGVFRFNVSSAYELTRLCVPHMRAAGGGNVINITSGAARYAQPYFSAYGTAKAALSQLTRLLAQDFAPDVARQHARGHGQEHALETPGRSRGHRRSGALSRHPGLSLGDGQDHRGRWRRRVERLARLTTRPH